MRRLFLATILLASIGCGRNNSEGSNTTPTNSADMKMSAEDMAARNDLGTPTIDMNDPVTDDMVVMDMDLTDMAPRGEDMPVVEDMPDPMEDMPAATPLTLRGSVSKGPFVLGSTVTVSELDASGNPTGKTYLTQTTNQLGEFEVEVATPAPLLVEGQGFWFNELVGELSGANFTLRGYLAKSGDETQSAYINVVTHMASGRVKTLVASGSSYPDAITQAQRELVAALGIGPDGLELGLSTRSAPLDASIEAAYAMGVGVLFFHAAYKREGSTEAEFQQLLNAVQIDLADNGLLDGPAADSPAELDEMQAWLDVRLTHAFLRRYVREQIPGRDLAQEPLPDLDMVIDSDRDGFVNAQDTCILTPNPDQADANGDGIGDACNFAYRIDAFDLAPSVVVANNNFYPGNFMCGRSRGIVTPQPDFLCWRFYDGVASPFHKVPAQVIEPPQDVGLINRFALFESTICAGNTSSEFRCWNLGQDSSTLVDTSAFKPFMNKGVTCWLTESMFEPPYSLVTGVAKCRLNEGTPKSLTGRYAQVVAQWDFMCGITKDKKLRCRTSSNDIEVVYTNTTDSEVLFDKIAVARTTDPSSVRVCGLRAPEDARPGEISCYTVYTSSQQSQTHFIRSDIDVLPGTVFTDIAVGPKICGIEAATKQIKCHEGEGPDIGEVFIPAGEFERVLMASDVICGLTGGGRPVCNKLVQPFLLKPL